MEKEKDNEKEFSHEVSEADECYHSGAEREDSGEEEKVDQRRKIAEKLGLDDDLVDFIPLEEGLEATESWLQDLLKTFTGDAIVTTVYDKYEMGTMEEIWRESIIRGYEVSNKGRVKAKFRMTYNRNRLYPQTGRILKQGRVKNGYKFVRLSYRGVTRKFYVHVLVAHAFLGPKPHKLLTVDHINRIRDDNRPENLRYATRQEQNENRVLNKEGITGENSNLSKLDDEGVIEIRKRYSTGLYTYYDLAKLYKVSKATIERIIRRETWRHLD